MKREPRLERLGAASRALRRDLRGLDEEDLMRLQALLERVLEQDTLDRDALRDLENALLP